MIDTIPDGSRASAAGLERYANGIAEAARKRDIETAGELVFAFDSDRPSCHGVALRPGYVALTARNGN